MLFTAISEKLGIPLTFCPENIFDGTPMVLQLVDTSTSETDPTYYALMFVEDDSETAKLIENAALVLQDLREFTDDLYCDSGEFNGQTYLLMKRLKGREWFRVVNEVKSIADSQERKVAWLELSLNFVKKVHELHSLGYLHGKIGAGNVRVIDDELRLFNFKYSCLESKATTFYRRASGYSHLPEVCSYVLQTSDITDYNWRTVNGYVEKDKKIIPYDKRSEIYSVVETLYLRYTNTTPIDLDHDPSLKEKFEITAVGKVRSFEEAKAEAFPEFEAVLMSCLHPDPDKRPTDLSEVIVALENIWNS